MMAAIIAAKNGCQVDLFEQNEKLGKRSSSQEKDVAI